jgi:hypothetical protein
MDHQNTDKMEGSVLWRDGGEADVADTKIGDEKPQVLLESVGVH